MDATDPAINAADVFIKIIHKNDVMAPDFINKLFRAVRDITGCTRDELPDIAIRAMAQAHKDNAECTNEAIKLVEASKNKVEELKMENAVVYKENEALKKKVLELRRWLEDDEEGVEVSDEHMK